MSWELPGEVEIQHGGQVQKLELESELNIKEERKVHLKYYSFGAATGLH